MPHVYTGDTFPVRLHAVSPKHVGVLLKNKVYLYDFGEVFFLKSMHIYEFVSTDSEENNYSTTAGRD